MKKITALLLVIGLVATFFCACSKETEDESVFVGTWTCNGELDDVVVVGEYVFNADGTGTAPYEEDNEIKWFVYEDKLYIEKKDHPAYYYRATVKDDTFTLKKGDNGVEEVQFTKVK